MRPIQNIVVCITVGVLFSTSAIGQNQPPAAKYAGSVSLGIAMTGGNSDSSNVNLALTLARVFLKPENAIKVNGLYLRGDQNKVLALDRTSLNVRDEYTVSNRTFLFGQTDYFRDRFKDMSYLVAPTAGAGHKLVMTDRAVLTFDGGIGGVFEKDFDTPLQNSGSLTGAERFSFRLSSAATVTQSLGSLWKMDNFSDSLSNFGAGITSAVSTHFDMKMEFIDSYKNRPARIGIKKNDTAFVASVVAKF